MQVAAGAAGIKWELKQRDTVGLLQVCLLSDAAAKVRCEMWDAGRAERSSAAGLSSEAVTHFMELNTEQTGWRQTLQHAAGYKQQSQLYRKGGARAGVCRARQY